MIIVVTNTFGITAGRIVKTIKELHPEQDIRLVEHYAGVKKIKTKSGDTVFGWGTPHILTTSECTIYNRTPHNKLSQLLAMRRSAEFQVPLVFPRRDADIFAVPDDGRKILLARKDGLFGGAGITICKTRDDVLRAVEHGCDFFEEYIPKIKEYRVHVCFGKAIGVSYKIPAHLNDVVWNNTAGGRQNILRNHTLFVVLSNIGKEAVKTVGYDYGAVDIIMDKYGRFYVLEVNSAPALKGMEGYPMENRIRSWAESFWRKAND